MNGGYKSIKVGDKLVFKIGGGTGTRGAYSKRRGTVIAIYEHYYLVQHKFYKACYLKVDFITREINILEINGQKIDKNDKKTKKKFPKVNLQPRGI